MTHPNRGRAVLCASAAIATLLLAAMPAIAQETVPAAKTSSGQRIDAAPVVIVNPDNTNCNFKAGGNCVGTGGPGGSLSATASATSVPVTAGTDKPLAIDLFSDLGVIVRAPDGSNVDWNAIVGVGGTSTAAAPTYVEGATGQPLSLFLKGGVRITPTDSTGAEAMDTTNHAVKVNVVAGGSSSGGTATAAAPTYTEGATAQPLSVGLKGGLRIYPQDSTGVDASDTTNHSVKVSIVSGGITGTSSNASSGVATSSTNLPVIAYNYVWNGTTWDQANPATGTAISGTVSLIGNQGVTETPNITATYTAAIPAFALAASGTDFLTITNTTNTKVSRLARLTLVCTAASAANINITMVKRGTSLDTGGTATTITPTAVDSSFSASQTIVKSYTANPTIGGTTANLRQDVLFANVTTAQPDRFTMVFGGQSTSAPSIRASTETIALNAGGVSTNATCTGSADITEQ